MCPVVSNPLRQKETVGQANPVAAEKPAPTLAPRIRSLLKDLTAEDRARLGDSVQKVLQKGSCRREDILVEVNRSRQASFLLGGLAMAIEELPGQ